jgi:hypothetical protein
MGFLFFVLVVNVHGKLKDFDFDAENIMGFLVFSFSGSQTEIDRELQRKRTGRGQGICLWGNGVRTTSRSCNHLTLGLELERFKKKIYFFIF